jgi:hypothetical protein
MSFTGGLPMKKLALLGIIGGAALLTATPLSLQWSQNKLALSVDSADAQVYGYGYPAYSYGGYGYPAYSYGGYYRPALGAGYLGYRIARRVAIHRARWR